MKKFVVLLAALAGVAVIGVGIIAFNTGSFDLGRLLSEVLYRPFGNFGGGRRDSPGSEPFDAKAIKFAIRWYPTFVSFGPDNDTLLVSLCHVDGPGYCRIGRYSLSQDKWDIDAFDELRTYHTPMFSPDGQWIYYSATQLCKDRRNFCDHPKLYRMKPDGTGVEMFADVVVVHPSFSADGKRMIYWGQKVDPATGTRSLDTGLVHTIDIEIRKVIRLTDRVQPNSESPPFLTADGEHFIFSADVSRWQGQTSCAVDPATLPADPKTGKKDFGPLFGDKENTGLYMAAIKDAPITKDNCYKLTPIWGKDSGHVGGYPCAMDGQGRFLYSADLGTKKKQGNPLALALRPADPNYKAPAALTPWEYDRKYPFATLTDEQLRRGDGARLSLKSQLEDSPIPPGTGPAAFLRRIDVNAPDEAVFDFGCGDGRDSISRDGSQLVFLWGSFLPRNNNAIAVLKQGAPLKEIRLILNWPKLDLIPTLPANR